MVFNKVRSSLIAVSILYHATSAFTQPTSASSRSTSLHAIAPAATVSVPSWVDLGESLPSDSTSTPEQPLVTLYRDTNGWCPFCERVWIALRVKNIPYQETLVNLQDKPDWFLNAVPTGLVPAVMIHTDLLTDTSSSSKEGDSSEEKEKTTPERTLVWESVDIMRKLDEMFPNHGPKLMNEDDAAFLEAREVCAAVQSAGFGLLYGGNATTTAVETEEKRSALEAALDAMDAHLSKVTNGGPFLLGSELSGVDIEVIPTLERFRYQFPLLRNVTLSTTTLRPNLQRWFEAIDASPAYASRVAGDEYSWTAVASTFLRIFGSRGNELTVEQNATIARVEAAATALTLDFVNDSGGADSTDDGYVAACREAAEKLIANHEAVVADCSRADPKSQKELGRSSNVERADLALRMIADSLLNNNSDVNLTLFRNKKDATEAAFALRTVAKRLSVPRDMGGPAAKVLRRRLMVLAQNMEANAKDSTRPLGIPRRSKFQSKL
uniref:GST N-terminal domain-containing protein n=1 Tax=Proboscia inermis TaxID=420281 RepID=A0A7S0BWH7_9STRA|mmetsp:Transcript_1347/g.1380  ORF Transcript_1347/g.1380 Transcript_1347/m.1380 type:complete len:495 (+) Transcript_1347:74-1558(+)